MPSSMLGPGIVTLGADGMTPTGRLGQPREVSPAFGELSDPGTWRSMHTHAWRRLPVASCATLVDIYRPDYSRSNPTDVVVVALPDTSTA